MINKLDELGLKEIKKINHNLSYDELFELEKANNEAESQVTAHLWLILEFLQAEAQKISTLSSKIQAKNYIAWGKINQPITKELFDKLLKKAKEQLSGKEIFIQDAFCGASKKSQKSVRFVTEVAWQAHFVKICSSAQVKRSWLNLSLTL